MRSSRLASLGAFGVVVAIVVGGVGGAGADSADTGSFQGSAAAEGARIGVVVPKFAAVEQIADGGAPVAQALVDSIGNSTAFASFPYPGDNGISGPSTVAGLMGVPAPPSYPFYAHSTYPASPDTKVSQPGVELQSHSDEQASASTASAGSSAAASAVAKASALRDPQSGSVVAEATSAVDGVNIGDVLRIGRLFARAKATRPPDGDPVRESEFRVEGISIAGQSVGLSDKGFVVAGTNTPLPDSGPLAEVMRQSGITATYLKPIEDADGIASAALLITQQHQFPNGPTVIVTYMFGRAVAHASATGGLIEVNRGEIPPEPGETAPGTAPAPMARGLGEANPASRELSPPVGAETRAPLSAETTRIPVSTGAKVAMSTGTSLLVPSPEAPLGSSYAVGGESNSAGSIDAAAPAPLPASGRLSGSPVTSLRSSSLAGLYVVLIMAALIVVAVGQLIRLRAVRSRWTS